jgi:hypothetical protein
LPRAHCGNSGWALHLRNPRLLAAFGIGFCILFAFIGTFTYVNFVLVRPPFMTGPILPLLLIPSFPAVLTGLVLVGVGTFFAQAVATGYVSRTGKKPPRAQKNSPLQ